MRKIVEKLKQKGFVFYLGLIGSDVIVFFLNRYPWTDKQIGCIIVMLIYLAIKGE